MKHCPECNRNYADPTLNFCLQDGAYDDRNGAVSFIKMDPRFSTIRDDPRFQELLKKVGFRSNYN